MSAFIQRSLAGGELDPVLWARSDIQKYMSGLRTLRNACVRRNGGIQGKPGSTKLQATKTNGNKVRLIPFVYNQNTTYMFEFGDKYVRVYQNGLPYNVGSVPAFNASNSYTLGDVVSSAGSNWICICNSYGISAPSVYTPDLNYQLYQNNFAIRGAPSAPGSTYVPGSAPGVWYQLTGSQLEFPTPYAVADLPLLKYDVTGNDMMITHPSYQPMRMSRALSNGLNTFPQYEFQLFLIQTGSYFSDWWGPLLNLTWVFSNSGTPPTPPSTGAANTVYIIQPIAANGDAYDEPINAFGQGLFTYSKDETRTTSTPSAGAPITLSWNSLIAGAVAYNLYSINLTTGILGYIGQTNSQTFIDNGITPDFANPMVQKVSIFNSANNYPSCCAFYQQRAFYGNTNNNPTTVWGSQTGLYDNFNINVPSLATDAMNFKMAGAQDVVQHLLSLGTLLVFTYGSINSIQGDSSGAISPSSINPHRESIHGSSSLRPLVVGEFALYVQSQGSIIRDLGFNFQVNGYRGDDITVFATHLFDGYTMTDWAYQSTPNSIVWVVRSDGTLLSCTYIREQQILAWSHHDTVGTYENVACVPEGNQVSVYVVANRAGTRYVERLYNQQFTDVRNFIGMDCATTIDGRNTSADTMTLSGGTNWDNTELLTLTLSANNFLTFTSGMATAGDMIFLYDTSGNLYRFTIYSYSSGTVVQGHVDRVVTANLATATWSHAITTVTGISYLNGYNVSVFADGAVVGSPNNPNYNTYTVGSGQVVLDQPYAVIQIGLPFITDLETLDVDVPGNVDNLGGRYKAIGEVTLYVVNSRSVFVGSSNPDTDLTNLPYSAIFRLTEEQIRQWEGYDSTMALKTGKITQTIQPQWDRNGHVFIRNVDPTPLIVAAISPEGDFPVRVA